MKESVSKLPTPVKRHQIKAEIREGRRHREDITDAAILQVNLPMGKGE